MRIKRSSAKNFIILTFFNLLTVLFVLNEAAGASITATQEWAATYDGIASQNDTLMDSAVDSSGNLYVTGQSALGMSTVKYDKSGALLWSVYREDSRFGTIAVDANGDVYIAGESTDPANKGYLLVKYNSTGVEQWATTYHYSISASGQAKDIALHVDGGSGLTYIYITGVSYTSYSSSSSADYATIKYDADGNQVWLSRFDAGGADEGTALVVDDSGNAYVTGTAYYSTPTSQKRYATVKYDKDGVQKWVSTSNMVTTSLAKDVAFDSTGNIVVTGSTGTIKYNTSGVQQWEATTNSANKIATDSSGNIFVTGAGTTKLNASGATVWTSNQGGFDLTVDSDGNCYVMGMVYGDTSVNINNRDYATTKYDPSGTELYTVTYDGGRDGTEQARSIVLYFDSNDSKTYVISSGESESSQFSYDYASVKYDAADGAEQWVARYDFLDSGTSRSKDIAVDGAGNTYVTGYTDKGNTTYSYLTIKYDAAGVEQWVKEHDFVAETDENNQAEAIAVDPAGNVYVTGTYRALDNYTACGTVKYDTDGILQWATSYDTSLLHDSCIDIETFVDSGDAQTYIYVLGQAPNLQNDSAITLIKYNSSGVQQWAELFNYSDKDDLPKDMVVDDNGNVYIAGTGGVAAFSFNAAIGLVIDKTGYEAQGGGYSIANEDSVFNAVTYDAAGNIYFTGYSGYVAFPNGVKTIYDDLVTVKYDFEFNEIWAKRYSQSFENAEGRTIAVDGAGNVYVAGSDDSSNWVLIKYNAAGVEQWVKTFFAAWVEKLSLDAAGNIYLIGNRTGDTGSQYLTVAYNGAGDQLWFEAFDGGPGGGYNAASSLVVTDAGDIYVTGVSNGVSTLDDAGTVKYSQALVTSDTGLPLIASVSPTPGATGVSDNVDVTVTFNEPMSPEKALDPSTLSVYNQQTGSIIPKQSVAYDEPTQTLTFTARPHLFEGYYIAYDYNTTYSAIVREGVTDLAGNPLGTDYTWSFTIGDPPDKTRPEVVSVVPAENATAVATNTYLAVTFNEPMLYTYLRLKATGTTEELWPQLLNYDEATFTATYVLSSALAVNTNYTATVLQQSQDLAGNQLIENKVWTFTTSAVGDTTNPFVISSSPADGATDVPVDIFEMLISFNEAMDQVSFFGIEPHLTLTNTETGVSTPYYVDYYSGVGHVNIYDGPLAEATTYSATLSVSTITDLSGNPLDADYTWNFTTAGTVLPFDDQTPPQVISVTPDGSFLVPPAIGILTVTFSEAMNGLLIEGVSDGTSLGAPFTVMVSGGDYVTGTVTYDPGARTARFVPDAVLEYDKTYDVVMKGDATDLAGNPIGTDYSWSFTTSPSPGVLGCDVDAGILEGCLNFDDFSYGTGVEINVLTLGTSGPTTEAALRKKVVNGRAFISDSNLDGDVESEAAAFMDDTQIRVEARSHDKVITTERDGATAFAASKIDVTGVPPGTLIPMTVTITRSTLGDTFGPELRIHDFDNRLIGSIIASEGENVDGGGGTFGYTRLTRMIDIYGDPEDPLNYEKVTGDDGPTMTFELLYPATPNNGIILYFATGAKKTILSGPGAVESDCTATVEFNPPPGVTVTLASGLIFSGELDSDNDGVADSEEPDTEENDASVATMQSATNTGLVGVSIDTDPGSGIVLSQCESLDDSDISINQSGKPNDHTFPDGLVSFNVTGLAPGAAATVTITFPTEIPVGAAYYKVDSNGFYEFPWATIGTNTVTLALVDGGAGDHDGVANGVIEDPGGIAIPRTCVAEIWYDGIDQSCKGGSDYDQDGDGFDLNFDCNDTSDAINPEAIEIWYNGINESCKAGSDYDQDGDGHDAVAMGGDDCDDTNPSLIENCFVDLIFKNSFE